MREFDAVPNGAVGDGQRVARRVERRLGARSGVTGRLTRGERGHQQAEHEQAGGSSACAQRQHAEDDAEADDAGADDHGDGAPPCGGADGLQQIGLPDELLELAFVVDLGHAVLLAVGGCAPGGFGRPGHDGRATSCGE